MSLSLPIAAEELVPHRLPMRLVERLLTVDGNSGVVEAEVTGECPLVDEDGVLEDIALVELIAQGYAALKGYLDRVENKPVRQGFLVGVKKLVKVEAAKAGDRLRIEVKTEAELEDFAVAEGLVWRGGQLVARGEIKVWIN